MKIKPTVIAVLAFIVLLVVMVYAEAARAQDGVRISLGRTVANSSATFGEIGYEWRRWELTAGQIGVGNTHNGPQSEVAVFSASRMVRPGWRFLGAEAYSRIGVAYVRGSPLVGDTNFRLGLGLQYRHFQIEYFHLSSAGIHQPNTGIDGIGLRLMLQ